MSDLFSRLEAIVARDQIVTGGEALERLSKDFYWYSPVLERQLKDKSAEIAVSPRTVEELKGVIRLAYELGIPVTPRGAGTGNYGQSIPLHGGILIDLMLMDRILKIDPSGYVVAEPGVRLAALEEAVRKEGWELRCYPSTFVKSSLGGFLSGGSGGVGSITYGGLRAAGTVRRVELLTAEAEPRVLELEGEAIFPALRAYGTTGIMTKIELGLGPKVRWGQIAGVFETFEACFDFTEDFARHGEGQKRLVTCFESPVPSYFTPLKKFLPGDKAAVFLEVDEAFVLGTAERLRSAGGRVVFQQLHSQPRQGPLLSDYTWNHTTLWAKKADPTLTYLQCGLNPDRAREQLRSLKEKFGDEFLFHVEFVKGGDRIVPGMLPLIRFTTEERLNEIIAYCGTIEVGVNNPHVFLLDRNEAENMYERRTAFKKINDPKALLNPGRLPGYPLPESRSIAAVEKL